MSGDIEREERIERLLAQLDDLYPLLQAEARDSERLRRPTPEVQSALRGTEIFLLTVPRELGGIGADPLQILAVIEKVAHADASMGWLVRALTVETATAASYLGDKAVAELFGTGRYPLVAGQSTEYTGRAVRHGDGFAVSGGWRFAPGLSMASHVNLAARVEGTGEQIVCLVPRDQLRISDNWDMLGLRATASLDYQADDVEVDETFTFAIVPGRSRPGSLVDQLGPALVSCLNQSAWSQGVGRRMLDELLRLNQARATQETPVTSDEFYGDYARHYSHVRGTMALLRETWTAIGERVRDGLAPSDEQETMARLASSLATRTSLEIAQLVHRFAGASVMRNGTVQRFFCDAHAGTQHRGAAHVVTQSCGRMLTGALPAGSHWGPSGLVVAAGHGEAGA